jgi:hypothetical protein
MIHCSEVEIIFAMFAGGFPEWQDAGYPVEAARSRETLAPHAV